MDGRHGRITSAVAVGFSRGLGNVCYWMDFCILAHDSYQPAALSRGGVSSFASRACTSSSEPRTLASARHSASSFLSAATSVRSSSRAALCFYSTPARSRLLAGRPKTRRPPRIDSDKLTSKFLRVSSYWREEGARMKHRIINFPSAVFAGVLGLSVAAHADVVNTFDTDIDGWRVGNLDNVAEARIAPAYNPPGGFLVTGDLYATVGFFAPAAFPGNSQRLTAGH